MATVATSRERELFARDIEEPYIPMPEQEVANKMKHDEGKYRLDLLPWDALEKASLVLAHGERKYTAFGWRTHCKSIKDFNRYEASLHRHLSTWMQGGELDEETGLGELHHLLCNIMFLVSLESKFPKEIKAMQKERRDR